MKYKWEKEVRDHKKFVEGVNLFVCACLDQGVSVPNIKKSLEWLVDTEVEKLKRARHE